MSWKRDKASIGATTSTIRVAELTIIEQINFYNSELNQLLFSINDFIGSYLIKTSITTYQDRFLCVIYLHYSKISWDLQAVVGLTNICMYSRCLVKSFIFLALHFWLEVMYWWELGSLLSRGFVCSRSVLLPENHICLLLLSSSSSPFLLLIFQAAPQFVCHFFRLIRTIHAFAHSF